MKKLILYLIITVISLKGLTQTSDSTACIPNKDLQKVLKAAELSKLYEKELSFKNKEVDILNSRISVKDSIIVNYNDKYILMKDNFSKIEGIYNLEKDKYNLLNNEYLIYQKQSKKEIKSLKRKNITKPIVGLAIGLLIGTLIIK